MPRDNLLRQMTGGIATRRILILGALVAGVMAVLLAAAPQTEAGTYAACVNKRTGEMHLKDRGREGAPCAAGWKKVTWTSGLPMVLTPNDKVVGRFLQRSIGKVTVQRDGGIWEYFWQTGTLVADNAIYFLTSDCTGQAFGGGYPNRAKSERISKRAIGAWRIAYRVDWDTLGKPLAYKGTGRVQEVPGPFTLYRFDDGGSGVCEEVDEYATYYMIPIAPTPAPPDFKGPFHLQ